MFLAKIFFAVFFCTSVTKYIFVSSEGPEDETEHPIDFYSYVALVDIIFVDGTKRTCTGTIIHDKAVITAAHCFLKHGSEYVDVELSDSFIVIGTKKMFDTGYEHYLPIERVVTHPNYKGWTADLALVFTFAAMQTDKMGRVIPLVEESDSTPVDSNVTILSWGNYCEEEIKKLEATKKKHCTSSEEGNEDCEPTKSKHEALRQKSREPLSGKKDHTEDQQRSFKKSRSVATDLTRIKTTSKETKASNERIRPFERGAANGPSQFKKTYGLTEVQKPALSIASPYLMPAKENTKKKVSSMTQAARQHRFDTAYRPEDSTEKEQDLSSILDTLVKRTGLMNATDERNERESIMENRRSRHKHLPQKETKLTVQSFGFVNVQTCKTMVEKALPRLYKINTQEVVCYAAEDHFISDDDSGAAAMREGHLVAVTVGGVECEGDHVAIGMKMACFCSWISENLPPGERKWKCCQDCCGEERNKRAQTNVYEDKTKLRTNHEKKEFVVDINEDIE